MITNKDLVAANNTAVLSNVVEVTAHALSEVLGNGSSSFLNGSELSVNKLREVVLARVSSKITEQAGG